MSVALTVTSQASSPDAVQPPAEGSAKPEVVVPLVAEVKDAVKTVVSQGGESAPSNLSTDAASSTVAAVTADVTNPTPAVTLAPAVSAAVFTVGASILL